MGFAVWKLGGSLLDLPDLGERIVRLHAERSPEMPVVIIPGGGIFADSVREMDRLHRLDPLDSHHLALDAMRLSASLVAALLQQTPICDLEEQKTTIQACSSGQSKPATEVWNVIDSWHMLLSELEQTCGPLPRDWRLTSDSIAAALAAYWRADELVLLKSIDRPQHVSWEAVAEAGSVDTVFSQVARHVAKISWVNLRAQ